MLDKHAAVSGVAIVTDGLGACDLAVGARRRVGDRQGPARGARPRRFDLTGTVEPFLTGLTQPVPVISAPDGAVLVGDWGTGTIYRIDSV